MENLKIEYWPVERLRPVDRELRRNDAAVPRMAEALRTFGFRVPLLVRGDGEIVDGHLRLKAALALGLSQVPVIPADDLTPTQVRTFRILVNRSATWAEWDEDGLRVELAGLRDLGADLRLTGFEDRELDAFLLGLAPEGGVDPDAAPEVPVDPVSRPGDLWILGRHRLLCGDSTRTVDVARLLDGERADMVWTDPPYNVDYKGKAGKIRNDSMGEPAFEAFLDALFSRAWEALADGGAVYVAHSEAGGGLAFRRAFERTGFRLSACLIWRKHQMVLGRGDYHWQHEPILYGWKPTARHHWYGDRKQTTLLERFAGDTVLPAGEGVWQVATGDAVLLIRGRDVVVEEVSGTVLSVPKPARSELHPTMKPVALVERQVANSSPRGGLVLDPCGGSGTTLMACERLGRRCDTMELDPRFADVIVRRWQEYSGGTAALEGGAAFDEIGAERLGEVAHA